MSFGTMTVRTPKMRAGFLKALGETGSVTASCQRVGVSRVAMYDWRNNAPEFAKEWAAAVDFGTDALEDEAVRRAHEGYDKPVFQGGQQIGTVREFSDVLMIFMLKSRRPDKYRERSSIDVNVTTDLPGRLEASRKRLGDETS